MITGAIALLAPLLAPLAQAGITTVGRLIAGDDGEKAAGQVLDTIRAVAGTDQPDELAAVLAANPAVAGQLMVSLGQIEADVEKARLTAMVADRADARAMTRDLASGGSMLAWGAMIVTLFSFTLLLTMVAALVFVEIPKNNETLFNILLGCVTTLAIMAAGFWVGSSAGSAGKSGLLTSNGAPWAGLLGDPRSALR